MTTYFDRSFSAPRSLYDGDEPPRVLSRDACDALFEQILSYTHGGGETQVTVNMEWVGNLRWARNRIISSGDTREVSVSIIRTRKGASWSARTTSLEPDALKLAVAEAERTMRYMPENPDAWPMQGPQTYLHPNLWSQATYDLDARARADVGFNLVRPAAVAGMLAAGYTEVRADTRAIYNTSGLRAYSASTNAEYSVTVRNPNDSSSGWAGQTHYDWAKINTDALTRTALQKCVRGTDRVVIEPGRYTVVLEPQAVHDLLLPAIYAMDRASAESMMTPYTLRPKQSKIGLRIFDERVNISSDPMDPDCGFVPFDYEGTPFGAAQWVKNGVLKELPYRKSYAVTQLGRARGLPNPGAYRMSGTTTPIEAIIASTWRGLLVTRLHDVSVIDGPTLQCAGTTRDGVWLIENGRVTHPIANFRFNESPMFMLNNIEAIGIPKRVYGAPAAMVPPLRVRDFNFNGLSTAI